MFGILLALLCAVLNSLSVVLQRGGLKKVKRFRNVIFSRKWILGVALSAVSFIIYVLAIKVENLSVVQPIVNSYLIFVPPISYILLKEKIEKRQILTTILVVIGILLLVIK